METKHECQDPKVLWWNIQNQLIDLDEATRDEDFRYCFDWRVEIPVEKHARFLEVSNQFAELREAQLKIEVSNGWLSPWRCEDDGCVYWSTNSLHPCGAGFSAGYDGSPL